MLIENESLKKIVEQMSKIELGTKDTYQLDGKIVPRVTEVLSAMIHDDRLLGWANSLGWKRISYKAFLKEAADKGSYSHLAIEKYLRDGSVNIEEFNILSPTIREAVYSCMDGFLEWWKDLHAKYQTVEIVFLEESMIHPFFGGTCDCLLKVNGQYYLIDFKTSNHFSYNYSLQLAAYRFLLRELKNINIDLCTILMLNKTSHSYSTYDLNLTNNRHLQYIQDCEQTFLMLLSAYKMRLATTNDYYEIFSIARPKNE